MVINNKGSSFFLPITFCVFAFNVVLFGGWTTTSAFSMCGTTASDFVAGGSGAFVSSSSSFFCGTTIMPDHVVEDSTTTSKTTTTTSLTTKPLIVQQGYYNTPALSAATWNTNNRCHRGTIVMGKGDGKKKRKKKSATASAASGGGAAAPPAAAVPRRVSSDINIPVKRQIRYAKQLKEISRQSNPGFRQKKVVRTKYRRTWDEEEIKEKAEQRKRRGQDPDWDVILSRNSTSPLVIVDGYNIIYKWPRLKKHMAKGDPRRARQLLIDDLENLRSMKGWRIEVVFDGTRRSTVGPLGHGPGGGSGSSSNNGSVDRAAKKSVTKHGIREVYSGVGTEADSYIESRCHQAKRDATGGQLTDKFIVATDDAMVRMAASNAGAMCMGAGRFVDELKALKRAIGDRVEAAVAKANGHAIRPEQLRTRDFQSHYFAAVRGGTPLNIEDRRKPSRERQKRIRKEIQKQKQKEEEEERNTTLAKLGIRVDEDDNGIPYWAQVPDQTMYNKK